MRAYKTIPILSLMLLLISFSGFAQITSDEALSEFVAAGMAYKEGRYDEAITRYNSIIDGGRVSGSVFYNLGNSYYKKGKFGQAILSYERAKQLIPRDSDLKFNHQYVLSQVEQYGGEGEQSILQKMIQGHREFYTIDEMVIILAGLIFSGGALFLLSLYLSWPKAWREGILAILVFGYVIYGLGVVSKVNFERDLGVIMSEADSYFEPRTDSTIHFKVSEGTKVRILKREGAWIKIERLDGRAGWIDQAAWEHI